MNHQVPFQLVCGQVWLLMRATSLPCVWCSQPPSSWFLFQSCCVECLHSLTQGYWGCIDQCVGFSVSFTWIGSLPLIRAERDGEQNLYT